MTFCAKLCAALLLSSGVPRAHSDLCRNWGNCLHVLHSPGALWEPPSPNPKCKIKVSAITLSNVLLQLKVENKSVFWLQMGLLFFQEAGHLLLLCDEQIKGDPECRIDSAAMDLSALQMGEHSRLQFLIALGWKMYKASQNFHWYSAVNLSRSRYTSVVSINSEGRVHSEQTVVCKS